jgi:imidazole glycerol-phosphate synthase subunit HisF
MSVRVIAKLDVKPPYVVKPVHFDGLRKMGKPSELAKKYYDQGADELFYIDIVSSLYQRNILFNEIENVANNLFIPFAAGGGVKNIDDFSKMLHMGADKVVINTFAIQKDPEIIDKAAKIFGSQAVVVNIEAKRWENHWECYTDCGRVQSQKDVFEWAIEAEQRGAGEILLQSVDMDGRCRGFDIELASKVVSILGVPVVVSSGAGSLEDIKELVETAKPSGIAIASILHYDRVNVEDIKKYLNNEVILN